MSYGKPHCYKTKIDELNREITELKNEAQLSDIAFDAVQEEIERLRNPWVSVGDHRPPKNKSFWVTWVFDGEMDGLEWYSCAGEPNKFWNLNSCNLNELGGDKQIPLFTHWMLPIDPLPNPPE